MGLNKARVQVWGSLQQRPASSIKAVYTSTETIIHAKMGTTQLKIGANHSRDTTAAKEHLREEGWCVIPHVLSKIETDYVLERLWTAEEASEKQGDSTRLGFLDPNPSNVRVFYLMPLDEIFLDRIQHPTAIESFRWVWEMRPPSRLLRP